ncbi:siderophore-interacting protein [Roseomonas marmotae]|uniref:Siderophore-interacting protein n=1 Tax=Roseomonas marmotae TaxID=2768161 RepID=A0ABS3KDN8_9PROT|nr:siderophore-interacting protein [Roseomonas marmotae]MBO1075579.1 siderophore-interacting protein [Roseomonas marmotae]QTI79443.1 siderophore-interacting protein [Roseomonas marmotae]
MSVTVRIPTRIRHPLRFRLLQVLRVERPTPHLCRVTLGGPELEGFTSAGFDDHVKVFFPAPGQERPVLPTPGPNGPVFPEGERPDSRDYTPRRFSWSELEIDFVLHGEGPASTWAAQAAPGRFLGIGGPRGSFVLPEYDWYLLVGDETALPAIARRLRELPAGARAIVLAEVADAAEEQPFPSAAEEQPFPSAADVSVTWLHRDGAAPGTPDALLAALEALRLPAGEGHAWVATESAVARALRALLLERHGLDKAQVKAAGYWKRGSMGAHERIED